MMRINAELGKLRAFLASSSALGYDVIVTEKAPISLIRKLILVAGTIVVLAAIGLFIASVRLPGFLRERAIQTLSTHFESDVQFSNLQIQLFPRARVTIWDLALRHNGRTDVPPLIQAKEIIVDATLAGLLLPKMHVASVRLIGLQIHTPPHHPGSQPILKKTDEDLSKKYPIVIDDIHADDALLQVLRAQPGKDPLDFDIHHLEINDFRFDRAANLHAILTNPTPKGEINSVGLFGPWQPEEPDCAG